MAGAPQKRVYRGTAIRPVTGSPAQGVCGMLESLSPREIRELNEAAARGDAWALVIRHAFDEGNGRLRLGLDRARDSDEIARLAGIRPDDVGAACERAARWCVEHGLHLMDFPDEGPGAELRYLMAVG